MLSDAAEKIKVAVSIPPQAYFVEQVGGELVDVTTILPAGASPHTYEPTATQMKSLSVADMYIRIKIEFENAWWDKIVAVNPRMFVVDSTTGTEFILGSEQSTETQTQGRDPHIWLSPKRVKLQAEAICKGLIAIDQKHTDTYTVNKDAFLKKLDALDQDIHALLANVKTRKFMVFHPAWAYFARDYHLEEISIEHEGKEPSAAEMTKLMEVAKQQHIRVIFVQPQTSRRSAETVAKQIGGRVEILDPIARNWMENMQIVAKTLAATLNEN